MKLTYIFHSGFVVETQSCVLVFDYWMDPADCLPEILSKGKPVYVLVSHFHEDHFSREIFSWRKRYPHTSFTYILSKDIIRHHRCQKDEADVLMVKGNSWRDKNLKVVAAGSNDSGVSWIVEVEGKRIFHAGDLNNWYARFLTSDYQGGTIWSFEFGEIDPQKDEKQYLGELKDIRKITDSFDVVLFPVDGRIGNGYTRGARQFIDQFQIGLFVPMHFVASGFKSAWRMKEFTDAGQITFWKIEHEGESIDICFSFIEGNHPGLSKHEIRQNYKHRMT